MPLYKITTNCMIWSLELNNKYTQSFFPFIWYVKEKAVNKLENC